jgi:P27 family predicted phage terminase small subunit
MGARGPIGSNAGGNVTQLPGTESRAPRSLQTKATPGIPGMPQWLDAEARAEWRRITKRLDTDLGILSPLDRGVLALYCDAWSRLVKTTRKIRSDGETVKGYRGSRVKHPAWQVYRETAALLMQLAKELGISPNARSRMALPTEEEDEADGILD